jgi:glycosyltransferase involved in cell wall biosynthesis
MIFFRFLKYKLFRSVVSYFNWHFYYKSFYKKLRRTKSDHLLKKGITAIVPVYNEEYHLAIVLESLLGIADQVVIMNNGSTDKSFDVAMHFQTKYNRDCNIRISNFPDLELVDLLNEGLKQVEHEWLLRWDADFINLDKEFFLDLKSSMQKRKRPAAFRLPYINLCGDYNNAFSPTGSICAGEFYLRSFNKDLEYKLIEGRLEVCVIPLYYKLIEEKKPYFIHLGHIKSVDRIMHRHIFMDWIDVKNNFAEVKNKYSSIDIFQNAWIKNVLQTPDFISAKFRFSRLLAAQCESIDDSLKKSFPYLLKGFIKNNANRFSVVYEKGKPFKVTDEADNDLKNYTNVITGCNLFLMK